MSFALAIDDGRCGLVESYVVCIILISIKNVPRKSYNSAWIVTLSLPVAHQKSDNLVQM